VSDSNRGVIYIEPGRVEVQDIPAAKLELDYQGRTRRCDHGAILRVVSTNI
jgi:glutathione-independent formaldehyde dehydrogenase